MEREKVVRIFRQKFAEFYFVVSRGKPKQQIDNVWFTHQDEIIGSFKCREIVCNVGQLPKLRSLENRESEWQIKQGSWVAICPGPFTPIPSEEPVYYGSFRGFRYFDFAAYVDTPESRIAL